LPCLLAASAAAHDGDPKLLDRRPMYPGTGWRNAQRKGPGGNLELTAPGLRFPKSHVTLFAWLSLPDLGVPAGGNANSCFGYTSPSGREYAIIGLSTGVKFVEVTQPGNPVVVAHINGPNSLWRDVRAYSTYCYAVSEGGGGIQVMNMANIDNGVVTLVGSVNDDGTGATHTVAVNPASGYLYRSGGGGEGLRIYNLNPNPASPARVGTWSSRYSHEVSVFSFTSGPAAGKEIAYVCGGLNGGFSSTGVYTVDVTNHAAPVQLQYTTYPNAQFCHQAWPSPNMQLLYVDDELDDQNLGINSLTRVMSLANPLSPAFTGTFTTGGTTTDHNQYTRGNLIYQSNYRSGLRVKSTSNPGTPTAPVETAYFDTWPEDDTNAFNGLWNNYPYFASGVVIGSDIEKGLFVWWVGDPQISITPLAADPATVNPGGGDVLQVQIDQVAPGTIVPGSELLHFDGGSGWVTASLAPQGGGLYEAVLPPSGCGEPVRYYFTAESTNGIVWSEPEDAPATLHHSLAGAAVTSVASETFEAVSGWVAGAGGDTATSGTWIRVDPNGTEAQPEDDHTASGVACYVTGQGAVGGSASANDVDGGPDDAHVAGVRPERPRQPDRAVLALVLERLAGGRRPERRRPPLGRRLPRRRLEQQRRELGQRRDDRAERARDDRGLELPPVPRRGLRGAYCAGEGPLRSRGREHGLDRRGRRRRLRDRRRDVRQHRDVLLRRRLDDHPLPVQQRRQPRTGLRQLDRDGGSAAHLDRDREPRRGHLRDDLVRRTSDGALDLPPGRFRDLGGRLRRRPALHRRDAEAPLHEERQRRRGHRAQRRRALGQREVRGGRRSDSAARNAPLSGLLPRSGPDVLPQPDGGHVQHLERAARALGALARTDGIRRAPPEESGRWTAEAGTGTSPSPASIFRGPRSLLPLETSIGSAPSGRAGFDVAPPRRRARIPPPHPPGSPR
jgi:choice-of-anchor B domain-containing protein